MSEIRRKSIKAEAAPMMKSMGTLMKSDTNFDLKREQILQVSSSQEIAQSLGSMSTADLSNTNTFAAVVENLKAFKFGTGEKTPIAKTLSFLPKYNESSKTSYIPAPLLDNEEERLQVIKELKLDEAPKEQYDNLTKLAAQLTDCPVSCLSIVEDKRQFFPSHYGIDATETPRAYSFCAHAILDPQNLFIVEDTLNDERFAGNPLVAENPHIRFYAGVPLVTSEGAPLGAFCVIDNKPKVLDENKCEYLKMIAKQAQSELDLRLAMGRLKGQMNLTEKLLQNILPVGIIERLKTSSTTQVADSFDNATILFADLVDFTKFASSVSAQELVNTLGRLFAAFDSLVAQCGVTKIKTIGDGYMLVGGVPEPTADHAIRVVDCGLKLLQAVKEYNIEHGTSFQLRIGINSGPVMAGVVGIDKFTYDCFGDSVNVASRMESQGKPGRIHISEATFKLVQDSFECERLNVIEIKGKGKLQTFFITKRK